MSRGPGKWQRLILDRVAQGNRRWNVEGNRLAAEATYDYLLTNRLLTIESESDR